MPVPAFVPLRVRSLVGAVVVALVAAAGVVAPVATPPAAADPSVGVLPTAEDFVTQQYEDFLSRPPDDAGLAYWAEQLEAGLEPSALVESLVRSPEFEGTIAPLVRLYYAFFQRAPDYAGLTYWAGVLRDGGSLGAVAQQFVSSTEFVATYGALADDAYVDRVYQNVFGRSADAIGRTYWVTQLAGGLDRGALMVSFSDSTEYRRQIGSQVEATMLYVGLLGRVPETDGLAYWSQQIGGGARYRDVIAGFLGTAEYDGRIREIYGETQPLSGVATRVVAARPALAVKVDNVDNARPQAGLGWADLVYEEMVEGELTRLVAVFHSRVPGVVGPVRSVRTTDFDLLDQLNRPLLAASGANAGILALVDQADLVNVNALVAGGAYYRARDRSAPHNLFAYSAALYDASNHGGGLPPQLFRYRSPGDPVAGGTPSTGVSIAFGRADVSFTWSAADRGWRRTQNGSAHTTSSGERLAPANVVVLEVTYGPSSVDARSPEAHTVGSGTAHVFTAGQRITGTWQRGSSTDRIVVLDGDGDEILLTPGQTFVELAPPGTVTID